MLDPQHWNQDTITTSVADPDPLVKGTDPDPSIIKQKVRKTLIPTVL